MKLIAELTKKRQGLTENKLMEIAQTEKRGRKEKKGKKPKSNNTRGLWVSVKWSNTRSNWNLRTEMKAE